MSYLVEIGKILAIVAALIALRFVVQVAIKNSGITKYMRRGLAFVIPPLITGGPMFITLAAVQHTFDTPEASPKFAILAFAGAVGLAIGLVMMLALLMQQQRQILQLQEQVAGHQHEEA